MRVTPVGAGTEYGGQFPKRLAKLSSVGVGGQRVVSVVGVATGEGGMIEEHPRAMAAISARGAETARIWRHIFGRGRLIR
jgi:hypothetical protein